MKDAFDIYLSTTSGVLGGTTGDQLGVPGEQVLVNTHVLVLSEDSVIFLQAILLQKSGIAKKSSAFQT